MIFFDSSIGQFLIYFIVSCLLRDSENEEFHETNYDQSSPFKHFNSRTIFIKSKLPLSDKLKPNHRSGDSLCKEVLT